MYNCSFVQVTLRRSSFQAFISEIRLSWLTRKRHFFETYKTKIIQKQTGNVIHSLKQNFNMTRAPLQAIIIVFFSFRCIINCGPAVIPSVKLSTALNCQGSECSDITSWDWILYEKDQSFSNGSMKWRKRSDLKSIASTPLNSSVIVIKENTLVGGRNYRLAVFVGTAEGLSGMSAYDMKTTLIPTGGECSRYRRRILAHFNLPYF